MSKRERNIESAMEQYRRDGESLRRWLQTSASDTDVAAIGRNADMMTGAIVVPEAKRPAVMKAAQAAMGHYESWWHLMQRRGGQA